MSIHPALVQKLEPIYRGEDVSITLETEDLGDFSGWTVEFIATVLHERGSAIEKSTTDGNVTLDNTARTIRVDLVRADTVDRKAGLLKFHAWRTDDSSYRVLAAGELPLK